jgi:hypothetical protein
MVMQLKLIMIFFFFSSPIFPAHIEMRRKDSSYPEILENLFRPASYKIDAGELDVLNPSKQVHGNIISAEDSSLHASVNIADLSLFVSTKKKSSRSYVAGTNGGKRGRGKKVIGKSRNGKKESDKSRKGKKRAGKATIKKEVRWVVARELDRCIRSHPKIMYRLRSQ